MTNQIKTVFLMVLLAVLIMTIGQILGGAKGVAVAFVISLVMNLGAYWFSADIVLAKSKAKVVGPGEAPQLYQLVEHLAGRAGLPTPKVAIVGDPTPNAFATGRNPKHAVVAVTQGLLNMMSREELAGVLGHELTHVKHRDILIGSIVAVMASAIMFAANLAKFGAVFRGSYRNRGGFNPIVVLLLAVLAPLAACLIQAAVSRSREYLADDGGADIAGSSMGLATALEKLERTAQGSGGPVGATPETASLYIVNPLSARSFAGLFSTHPPTQERIARLRGLRP
ncbi:MAG: zinc metalloprotease HtpX [Deltaproteobacteria bacterium]|nr:zinc metalloprotease HtpX [Deltaproteobacteria bacterium]